MSQGTKFSLNRDYAINNEIYSDLVSLSASEHLSPSEILTRAITYDAEDLFDGFPALGKIVASMGCDVSSHPTIDNIKILVDESKVSLSNVLSPTELQYVNRR